MNSEKETDVLTPVIKWKTLKKISYILTENYKFFYDAKVSFEEINSFIRNFESVYNNTPDEDYAEEKEQIRNEINRTVKLIESQYKSDKLEGIR